MDLGRPSADRNEICTQYRGGAKADHLLSIFFSRPLKIWRGKTTIFEHRHQLEVHNFETAQHIDKRISDVSSRITALQNGTKVGTISPRGFLQPREKVVQRENSRILSNSAKFSAGRPLLPAYNFSATVASTCSTCFGAMSSLKSLATENMPRITVSIFDDCRQLEAHNFDTAQNFLLVGAY